MPFAIRKKPRYSLGTQLKQKVDAGVALMATKRKLHLSMAVYIQLKKQSQSKYWVWDRRNVQEQIAWTIEGSKPRREVGKCARGGTHRSLMSTLILQSTTRPQV